MPANHHQIIMTQSEDERLHDSDDDDSIKEELDVRSGHVKQLFTRHRCQSQPERGMTCNQLMHLQETESPWRIHHSFVMTKGRCCWMRCGQNISPPTNILILRISTTAGAGVPDVPIVVIIIVVVGVGAPIVPVAPFIAAPFVGVGAPVIPIVLIPINVKTPLTRTTAILGLIINQGRDLFSPECWKGCRTLMRYDSFLVDVPPQEV